MPFFKNDDSFVKSSTKDKPMGNYARAILEDGWAYDVIDDIFESASGKYYVWCWDTSSECLTPIDIFDITVISLNDSESFINKHLNEYKEKYIRKRKLERIDNDDNK